jgi:dihydrofolate synthase / folylpolyglutamate synthase
VPTYQETLDYLFAKLPMYQRTGEMIRKIDLANIQYLCKQLGDPHNSFKTIHIAGTNGKGSVTHMMASCLQEAGYKTGIYVSPHYKDFRERIRINGRNVSSQFVMKFTERVKPHIEKIKPSFFEITVAMAFAYFKEKGVQWAVIETGLGGRLDSTNIVIPELSVITNISYDHMAFLGDTLPKIAGEKAGIIKPGVPVLIGEYQPAVKHVFQAKSKELQAPIRFASKLYKVARTRGNYRTMHYEMLRGKDGLFRDIVCPATGPYQEKNILTSIAGILWLRELGKINVSNAHIKSAFKNLLVNTNFIGRWQQLGAKPLIIADSAHNEAGIQSVWKEVRHIPHDRLHIVFGTVKDKDPRQVLAMCPRNAIYYYVKADIPRGMDAYTLSDIGNALGRCGSNYTSVRTGYNTAVVAAKPKDMIFICGSIFVVAELI